MEKAILYLKEHNIEAFEHDGILVIPCSSPEEIYDIATTARRLFKECGFDKSWRVDPYYYDRLNTLQHEMFS